MPKTYKAILDGDHVEWRDEPPGDRHQLEVCITVLDPAAQGAGGTAMSQALEEIAARGGPQIDDPLAWQRDLREDRVLPGRSE